MDKPFVELQNISKCFPGVVALDRVSMEVHPGEVVALVGENGAGKSTLMKILGGLYVPDTGDTLVQGTPVHIRSAAQAIRLGIAFIHQELNVLDNLDVAANVFLGREPLWGGPLKLVDRGRIYRESETHLQQLGLSVSPRAILKELSLAQQQMVEIAKALSQNARLLIMDEPTSCLTQTETERLLATIGDLRTRGVSVIYISHRLGEIERCADRVVVLRDGRNAGALLRGEVSHQNMVRLMVGRELKDLYVSGAGNRPGGGLEVQGLRTRAHPAHHLNFAVARGEILGFAGLVGAGRSEMAQALFGVEPPIEGRLVLDGKPLTIRNARDAIAAGIYLVPEDRRRTGLVTEMTVRENITLGSLWRYTLLGLIRGQRERQAATRQVAALGVRTASLETKALNLSGGNQQKVVLAKWLAMAPKVLLLDEPTRGIDVGAKAEIYGLMRKLANSGVAIIMISSEMEEVLGVSDRIAVMHEGRIAGFLERPQFSEEAIMRLAVGKIDRDRPPNGRGIGTNMRKLGITLLTMAISAIIVYVFFIPGHLQPLISSLPRWTPAKLIEGLSELQTIDPDQWWGATIFWGIVAVLGGVLSVGRTTWSKELGIFLLLLFLCAVVSVLSPGFFGVLNQQNMARLVGRFGILSLGAGLVIITSGIDLSVGSLVAFGGVLLAMMLRRWHWPWPVSVTAVIGGSLMLGAMHGLLITRLRLQPFIVTLCGLLLYRGLARFITGDQDQGFGNDAYGPLRFLAKNGSIGGIPMPFLEMVLIGVVMAIVVHRSVYGRYLFAVGRNEDAARYSGINTRRIVIVAYVLCAGLTSIVAVIDGFDSGSISPSDAGNIYELYGIAAAVLGGCSLRGGEGSVIGIILGTMLLQVLQNLVNLLDIPSSLNFAVMGAVILLGVLADEILARRKKTHRPLAETVMPTPAMKTEDGAK